MTDRLTPQEVTEAFRKCYLKENHIFLEEDLQELARGLIRAAEPKIAFEEKEKCIKFVRSLNTQVAQALQDFKGEV
jgi:hypothetical protein